MASLLNNRGGALMNTFTPPQRDYSLEYFTIESLADSNTVSIKNVNCNTLPTFYYSTDNGTTWSSITAQKGKTLSVTTINTGDKILFKCSANKLGTSYSAYNCFLASGNHIVYGNAMSLLYGDNFASNLEFPSGSTACLVSIFRDDTYLLDASNLILPAMVCVEQCYNGMFRSCTNLAHAPKLPALTLAKGCYGSMFEACVNLEEAPELPALTLAQSCYGRMFQMARSGSVTSKITRSPLLRAANLVIESYGYMFQGNASLVEVRCLAETYINVNRSTLEWLKDTPAAGVFYKASSASWPTGVNGIPSGWTVVDYVES